MLKNGPRAKWIGLLVVVLGCGGRGASSQQNCDAGTLECSCARDKTCGSGLLCKSGTCVKAPTDSSGGSSAMTGTGGMAASSNFTSMGGTVAVGSNDPGVSGGGVVSSDGTSGAMGNLSCEGLPTEPQTGLTIGCNGVSTDAEPLPMDLILLVDRSLGNSYAPDSESATPPPDGVPSRWDYLTMAFASMFSNATAQSIRASLTFSSVDGTTDATRNCDATEYAKPVVPLGPIGSNGASLLQAMQTTNPEGQAPTVPALIGAIRYATVEKQKDSSRDKVVVLIGGRYPTQCDPRSPSDVANVAKDAANAETPIRTIYLNLDEPPASLARPSIPADPLKSAYSLDYSLGASSISDQIATALLTIANSGPPCEYLLEPPVPNSALDVNRIMLTYQPTSGEPQEIPWLENAASCAGSSNGGWYFDDNVSPNKLGTCPCSCRLLAEGTEVDPILRTTSKVG